MKRLVCLFILLFFIFPYAAGCDTAPAVTTDGATADIASTDSSGTTAGVETDSQPAWPVDGITPYKSEVDTLYATWINVWFGSTESWWGDVSETSGANPGLKSSMNIKTKFSNGFQLSNSNDAEMRREIFAYAKDAGVEALIMDLTNGYTGWGVICRHYEMMCFDNYMNFSVATHPRTAAELEDICRHIYTAYVAGDFGDAYLFKNNKPLMVLYCTPAEWKVSAGGKLGEYAQRFEFVWASGENSQKDKWGWQLDPEIGPELSSDSMFLTPSVVWNTPNVSHDSLSWRRSLAMLDFCFLAQREALPAYSVVGAIDDPTERNGWLTADTSDEGVIESLKIRDKTGALSTDALYNRVKEWISGEVTTVSGGLIPDGAYKIVGADSASGFGAKRPSVGTANDIDAVFYSGRNQKTEMEKYFFFYHIGNGMYRIIKLSSGLALDTDGGLLIQTWESTDDTQIWQLEQSGKGFTLKNKGTGTYLTDAAASGGKIALGTASEWSLVPVANRQILSDKTVSK